MSRIDSGECFCMDMEWYGVDKKGNIAVFCSAGEGYLPEFVCEDVERAEELMEYFDTAEKYYTKHSAPLRPLKYEKLPEYIKSILGHNRMDVEDFSAIHVLHVKHAYEV